MLEEYTLIDEQPDTRNCTDDLPFLSTEAVYSLLGDQKPDGKNILWKLICMPGQYILNHINERGWERMRGVSPALLRKAFSAEAVDSGWLSPGVCRWGSRPEGDWMVKFYPASAHTLDLGEQHRTATVVLPSIVFGGIGNVYYVWATKTRTFSPHDRIFVVPLPNVYHDGRICFGNNTPPTLSWGEWDGIDTAWNLFVESPFNGDLAQQKSRAHPVDVREQLSAVDQRKRQRYPLSDLIPYTVKGGAAATVETAVHAYLIKSTLR
jgi:hypothetical protein